MALCGAAASSAREIEAADFPGEMFRPLSLGRAFLAWVGISLAGWLVIGAALFVAL